MNYPAKKKDQERFMGRPCVFTAKYYRDYGKKKIEKGAEYGYDECVPVKWSKQRHVLQTGWIVGFGYVYTGEIVFHSGVENYKEFVKGKAVKYVRVRKTTISTELKIPLTHIKLI
jgi:hypothetical protein